MHWWIVMRSKISVRTLSRLGRPGLPTCHGWHALVFLPSCSCLSWEDPSFPSVQSFCKAGVFLSEVAHCTEATRGEGIREFIIMVCPSLSQDPIRLRYSLVFTQGLQPFREVGEVTGFPEAELWGRS